MSARDFAAILREKIFTTVEQKKTKSNAEFDPGTLARFAEALFEEGVQAASDFEALKTLWEHFFAGAKTSTTGGSGE